MKKNFYLIVISLLMASCSSEPHYVVKGKIEGSDSITFYLQKREAGKIVNIDSALSKKGPFTLKSGKIDYPQMIQLVAGNTRKRTSFYLENSEIIVTGTLDSLYKATITGSKTQDEYQSLIDSNKPLSDKYSEIVVEFKTANSTGDTARIAILEKQADSVQNEMTNLQKNFVKNNPGSYVSPSILASMSYDMEATEIESIINAMDTAVASIPQVVLLKERVTVMKKVAIGQKAPDFTSSDVDG